LRFDDDRCCCEDDPAWSEGGMARAGGRKGEEERAEGQLSAGS